MKEIAEVSVNGTPVGGVLRKPPFQSDVTSLLKPGTYHLEIKITNLWPNRMIGDLQPGVTKTYTFTDYPFYKPDSPSHGVRPAWPGHTFISYHALTAEPLWRGTHTNSQSRSLLDRTKSRAELRNGQEG